MALAFPGSRAGLARDIRSAAAVTGEIRCCVGFDGFIDSVFRVVRKRVSPEMEEYFGTISEFAARVAQSAGKSSDTEIVLQDVRFGGNGPLLANALARLGFPVTCIGTLGLPRIEDPFRAMPENCACLSVGNAGRTFAFEFSDGKLMFGQVLEMCRLSWEDIRERVGLERLLHVVRESRLVGVVNWLYLHRIRSIVEGLCRDVLSRLSAAELDGKHFLFDMADISTREPSEVRAMCHAMELVAERADSTLGLNDHEAKVLLDCLGVRSGGPDLGETAWGIARSLSLGTIVVHAAREAVAVRGGTVARAEGFHVESPRVTTGGGDAFNGGFCMGLLLGFDLPRCLATGSAVSSLYVSTGRGPSLGELGAFLEKGKA